MEVSTLKPIIKVAALCGSLRKSSYNYGLIRSAIEMSKESIFKGLLEIEYIDISPLPMLNTDLEVNGTFPPAVQAFRRKILEADSYIFASPEYNFSVTAPLKNAMDWASRPPNVWGDKAAAIVSAGGQWGGGRSHYHLRQIGVFLDIHFINKPEFYLNAFTSPQPFDSDGNLIDEPSKERLKQVLLSLQSFTLQEEFMEKPIIKVAALCGSLRKASFHRGLITSAIELSKDPIFNGLLEIEYIDISPLPMLNTDLEVHGTYPPPVEAFRRKILEADSFLFASPEYNYSVTAPLKNAMDWASRPPNVWGDKAAAIVSAGGDFGGGRSQYHLRQIGIYLDIHFINKPEFFLNAFKSPMPFDSDGNLIDQSSKERLKEVLLALQAFTLRLKAK
ncbi:hypothetical protein F8388_026669 [Cannabis sativa]|uniref:NAD(P)H dehydrogenase (quinone) n=1 Tax=Cannabis sativa TaxID=3483 RepID=A0A7J6H324_CANSA|nr:hypothetical protein F8388_026669 [Cannabis sativa]